MAYIGLLWYTWTVFAKAETWAVSSCIAMLGGVSGHQHEFQEQWLELQLDVGLHIVSPKQIVLVLCLNLGVSVSQPLH